MSKKGEQHLRNNTQGCPLTEREEKGVREGVRKGDYMNPTLYKFMLSFLWS